MNLMEMGNAQMDDSTFNWMIGLSDEKLVDVLFDAGRINYDEKDYWLKLIPAIREQRTARDIELRVLKEVSDDLSIHGHGLAAARVERKIHLLTTQPLPQGSPEK